MAATTLAQVRQGVSDAIEALSAWRPSRFAHDYWPNDPGNEQDHTFSVGVPRSVVHQAEGRQRTAEGALVETAVEVRFALRCRSDRQVDDYDTALVAGGELIKTVEGSTRTYRHILLVEQTYEVHASGFVFGVLSFRAIHHLALE